MAIPQDLLPQVDRISRAITGVAEAVNYARFDRRTDEPDSGLCVDQAITGVEAAAREWFAASAALEASLEGRRMFERELEPEIQSSESALTLLHWAVMSELALAQPLDWIEGNPRLRDIPGWPSSERTVLLEASTGSGGLLALLRGGTDDDPALPPFEVYSEHVAGDVIRKILFQSADATRSVFAGLLAAPLVGAVVPGAADTVRQLLERLGEWQIDLAIDGLPHRISALVRSALRLARRMLLKVLGTRQARVASDVGALITGGASTRDRLGIAQLMSYMYYTGDVGDRAYDAFTAPGATAQDRRRRGERLRKLEKSNKRWVGPVEKLSLGLGPLWIVSIPLGIGTVAAAPAAAAVLLAWLVLMSGDQLDAKHYPDFWKGVVRRAAGE
ncbi:hypothetical protein [Nocardia sp. NBC_01327]|uniref:hypothetical protein n=1 Tax=Nocardia sp. NBC_01327 TaxID=2903593 RepID=UPI002E140D2E|nr:hypothetical protein OG326_22425 [Nocardia sp. NBC_01327]